MPSGSHGGSGGSHSSGGSSSSSSGFSFGGSSRNGSSIGSRFVFLGGSGNQRSSKFDVLTSICIIFMMFSFIVMFAGFVIMPTEKKQINKIKEDYYYYQDIISLGNITTAKVTDIFAKDGRYYITYSIDLPNYYFDLEGYSYAVYSRADAMRLLATGEIEVALNKPLNEADMTSDSIPTDYKDMLLTKDIEYVNAVKGLRTSRICAYVGLSVFVCGIIGLTISIKKLKGKSKQTVSPTVSRSTVNGEQYSNCPHCGCRVRPHQDSCSACGNKIE